MSDPIQHKRSNSASSVPTSAQLKLGELAINTADGLMFFKKSDDSVVAVAMASDIGDIAAALDAINGEVV